MLWSLATLFCGLANSFAALFIARVFVGFGEACLNPSAYSMMCDYFPPQKRGRAFGLFASAGSMGSGASLLLGTAIFTIMGASTVVAVPLLGGLKAWQLVFIVAGLIGIAWAALLATIVEPARREQGSVQNGSRPKLMPYLQQHWRLMVPIMGAFALFSFAHYACLAWISAFYMRSFGMGLPKAGLLTAFILPCGGIVGSFLGGLLGDRFQRMGTVGARLNVTLWAAVLTLPALTGWLLTDNLLLSVASGFLFFSFGIAGITAGPIALSELVPNELRGQIAAVYMLIVGLVGLGAGPSAVAFFTDFIFEDRQALPFSLVAVAAPTTCVVVFILWRIRPAYSLARTRNIASSAAG